MERMTNAEWRNDDPWELCGLREDCYRHCVQNGEWCPVALKLRRLAAYEDTNLAPEDIPTGLQLANVYCALQKLKKYEALGTPEELKSKGNMFVKLLKIFTKKDENMKQKTFYQGAPGVKYGIWNSRRKCWQFGICEDTPMLAEARLFQKIGNDARKFRFESRPLPKEKMPPC